jgi:hypothetical protein
MAESPRTAQNVDYIMNDTENICHYLKILAEKENSVENKTAQAEMLMAIDRLTAAIDGLHLTCCSIDNKLTGGPPGSK